MPKISSVHPINVTVRAATAIAMPGPGTLHDGAGLILDIDKPTGTRHPRRHLVSSVESSVDAPATISICAAIDRLAGGKGADAADLAAEGAAENEQLRTLIDACRAERDADPRFVALAARLPYGSAQHLIEIIEQVEARRPPAADELLAVARGVQARRAALNAEVARWLSAIIEMARADELELWGDTDIAAHAETEKLPRHFLLRNITLDWSLRHLGLAQARTNPYLQRAIIARDGPRSAAYFNVRIVRADFERQFRARLSAVKLSANMSDAEQQIRTWYVEQHVPRYEARGEIPKREQSEADAQTVFGDIDDMRGIMRRCRNELAPATWRAPGRRREKKSAKK